MKENLKPYVYKQIELYGKVKYLRYEAEEKSSLKRANKVICNRPETG